MNVKQLRAFVTVAKYQSFAQAGEHLHVSQPALSLTIKALEDNLGGALLSRTTRSVSLTPEGEVLLPWPGACWPTGTTPRRCCASVSPCNWAGCRWRPCRPLPATCCRSR